MGDEAAARFVFGRYWAAKRKHAGEAVIALDICETEDGVATHLVFEEDADGDAVVQTVL